MLRSFLSISALRLLRRILVVNPWKIISIWFSFMSLYYPKFKSKTFPNDQKLSGSGWSDGSFVIPLSLGAFSIKCSSEWDMPDCPQCQSTVALVLTYVTKKLFKILYFYTNVHRLHATRNDRNRKTWKLVFGVMF